MARKLLIAGAIASAAIGAGSVAAASDGETAAAHAEEPNFVALEEIAVPIVGTDRIEGSLRVKLVVQAAEASGAAKLTDRLPELRAATIAATLEFSRLYASAFTPVNAERLRADLAAAVKRANPAATGVLIVEVAAQKA